MRDLITILGRSSPQALICLASIFTFLLHKTKEPTKLLSFSPLSSSFFFLFPSRLLSPSLTNPNHKRIFSTPLSLSNNPLKKKKNHMPSPAPFSKRKEGSTKGGKKRFNHRRPNGLLKRDFSSSPS